MIAYKAMTILSLYLVYLPMGISCLSTNEKETLLYKKDLLQDMVIQWIKCVANT